MIMNEKRRLELDELKQARDAALLRTCFSFNRVLEYYGLRKQAKQVIDVLQVWNQALEREGISSRS